MRARVLAVAHRQATSPVPMPRSRPAPAAVSTGDADRVDGRPRHRAPVADRVAHGRAVLAGRRSGRWRDAGDGARAPGPAARCTGPALGSRRSPLPSDPADAPIAELTRLEARLAEAAAAAAGDDAGACRPRLAAYQPIAGRGVAIGALSWRADAASPRSRPASARTSSVLQALVDAPAGRRQRRRSSAAIERAIERSDAADRRDRRRRPATATAGGAGWRRRRAPAAQPGTRPGRSPRRAEPTAKPSRRPRPSRRPSLSRRRSPSRRRSRPEPTPVPTPAPTAEPAAHGPPRDADSRPRSGQRPGTNPQRASHG